ncbi:MAG: hypothetical protein ACRDV0_10760, partial [Acidimicrobiales bacterium]
MSFSISEKPTIFRLPPELRAKAEDEASRREWKLGPFCAWALRQILSLEFLDADNRAFVERLRQELGGPWRPLDIVNALVGALQILSSVD